MKTKCLFIAVAVVGLAASRATAETATNIINGVTVNTNVASGIYYVGQTGPYNVLIIMNGGILEYQAGGTETTIGDGAGSSNNSVIVTGTGSQWNTHSITIGNYGAGNTLTITNGGVISDTGFFSGVSLGSGTNSNNNLLTVTGQGSALYSASSMFIGDGGFNNQLAIANGGYVSITGNCYFGQDIESVANNNHALITGSGSVFSVSGSVQVGSDSYGNQMTIANGGHVLDSQGVLGASGITYNDNNRVTVTGAGSVWNNSNDLRVGGNVSANYLTITNGGLVVNTDGHVGHDFGADNNSVLVTGSGSVWSNTGSLFVGNSGADNLLTITNGGAVTVAANAYISYTTNAANNQIILAGGGSLTVTNSGGGTLDVRNGTLTFNGGALYASQLLATNNTTNGNSSFIACNYGALATYAGAQIVAPAGSNFIIGGTAGQTATWNILGGTNTIQPVISNSFSTVLGGVAGATGSIFVTGSAAILNNAGALDVRRGALTLDGGVLGANMLLVTNNTASATNCWFNFNSGTLCTLGAQIVVPAGSNFNIGNTAGQTATWNILSGTNSVLPVAGKIAGIYLGGVAGASANILVSGTGTVWTNGGVLYVGAYGTSSQLIITNGGTVYGAGGYIGANASASNNTALVTGSGSTWNNRGATVVGNDGVGNTLTITNSGRVVNADGYIGGASSNNTALVTDGGSVWNNTGNLTVGNNGPGNRLTVTNGGVVTVAGTTFVGYNSSASNNTMLVTGSGSVWSNSGTLYFGYQGAGNQLTLADSGSVVVAGNAYVGYNAGSTNNQIAVAGGNLTVTNAGATGTLNVNYGALTMNGGTVTVNQLLANGGNSVVQFSGGTLNTMATTVANGSPFTVGDGTNAATLNLQGGTHNFANGLVISAAAQVCGAATINGNVTNNGALGSGASVSTLTIASNYTQNAGSALNIKLGGIAANDVLAVSGTAQLGGTLTVMNLNGFQPALSNAFTILTAQSVSGTFASANLPALGGSLAWQLTYAPTSVALSVVKAPLSALKFTASPVISGTSLTISATNTGVGSVYLLTSTNAAAPLNTWTPIWTNVLNGNSSFTTNLLNAVNPALHQQFYLLGNTNN